MKPELRRIHSPDLLDLGDDVPSDTKNFCILIQALVGPAGLPGEESFDFLVCSPSFIAETVSKDGFLIPRHYIILDQYNYAKIMEIIKGLCSLIYGDKWADVAEKLGRYGHWEFEDYHRF